MYTPPAYYTAGGFVMLNDILIFALSLWGIISLLFTLVFKLIIWRIEPIVITLPLYKDDPDILNKIFNIRSFFEFCSIEKRCTVVLINYDAPECVCNEILSFYEKYGFVKIVSRDSLPEAIKELHT